MLRLRSCAIACMLALACVLPGCGVKGPLVPAKKGTAKTARTQPPIDEEMAEIEALLKSRGLE